MKICVFWIQKQESRGFLIVVNVCHPNAVSSSLVTSAHFLLCQVQAASLPEMERWIAFNLWLLHGYKCVLPLPQFGPALKGCPSFRGPWGPAEASFATTSQPSLAFNLILLISRLTYVSELLLVHYLHTNVSQVNFPEYPAYRDVRETGTMLSVYRNLEKKYESIIRRNECPESTKSFRVQWCIPVSPALSEGGGLLGGWVWPPLTGRM